LDNSYRIEDRLKALILEKYKSIREFAIEIQLPYSTLDSIFKRGVHKASITNIINICRALGISTDMLAAGEIVSSTIANSEYSRDEKILIESYRSLNADGKNYINITMDMAVNSYKSEDALKTLQFPTSQNKDYDITASATHKSDFPDMAQAQAILDNQREFDRRYNKKGGHAR